MTTLLENLEALGAATAYSLWLPMLAWSAFLLLALGVVKLCTSAHARIQHDVRLALLFALPLGLLAAALTDLHLPTSLATSSETLVPVVLLPAEASPILPAETPAPSITFMHLLGLLALTGVGLAIYRLTRLALDAAALSRFAHQLPATPAPEAQRIAGSLARHLGLRRHVHVVASSMAAVPFTFGWRRPTILIPTSLLASRESLRMTILHELIHIRRHDFLLHGAARAVEAVFAINPMVWLLRRSLAYYREAACDAEVLAQPAISRKNYATLLYHFALPHPPAPHAVLSMSTPEPDLKKRILAMKNTSSSHPFTPSFIGLLLSAVLLGTAVTFVACADLAGPDLDVTAEKQGATPEVFVVVEQMPELVGGLEAIQEDLQYPAIAKKAGIQGRVIVQFIVNEQGQVVEPEVIRGIGAGADEEALRVVQNATFEPGMQRGVPVPVKMSLPVTFKLDGTAGTVAGNGSQGSFVFEKPQVTGTPKMDANGIYVLAEEMPTLQGGLLELQRQMQYPAVAKAAGIEGRVIVQFVIDENGRVTNPEIVRGVGHGLDEEALRIVQQARFTPGKVDNQPVPVKMSLPLTFKLTDKKQGSTHQ